MMSVESGIGDWLSMALLSGIGFLVFLALLFTVAALGRNVFFGPRER